MKSARLLTTCQAWRHRFGFRFSGSLLMLLLWSAGAGCTIGDDAEAFTKRRHRMVEEQLKARDIGDPAVLKAMKQVPRHEFVPKQYRDLAYADRPLPIGESQTISQPYIVALMTQLLKVKPEHKVLEVGTGSGYQAAVLHEITPHVYTIEIVKSLARQARKRLVEEFGFEKEQVIYGDGYNGLKAEAPFDRIIVTAAPDEIPPPLLEQLARGGRMVVPVGEQSGVQELMVVTKNQKGRIDRETVLPVRFVPMTRNE